jgi:hypothetical protein
VTSQEYQGGPQTGKRSGGPEIFRGHASLGDVLRLLDTRTGTYAEVRPARPGLLRVCAHISEPDLTGLRVLLLGDLLARAAELRNLQVFTALASSGQTAGQPALERAAEALGIHPPAVRTGLNDAEASLGGRIDVHLTGSTADDRHSGLVVLVGAAHTHQADAGDLLAGHEHEPSAIRLALLSFPYTQPADLTTKVMADADSTVARWRLRVTEWAELPSRPMPAQIEAKVRGIFDDLDTVSALALLRSLASDEDVPAGARFETFVYADRVLGLDLPRDIGRAGR